MQTYNPIQWKPEYTPCPICDSEKRKRLGARGGHFQRHGKGIETDVVRCLNCKVLYTYPTLLPESNPYENETADEYFQLHNSELKIAKGEELATFAENVLGKSGKMLEIGCGQGELLIGAARRGWQVCGIEMTEHYAKLAQSNDIEIEIGSVENSKLLKADYDVILLAAILEHLYNPLEILKKVRSALCIGGMVFIDVPNESSFTMRAGNFYMKMRGRDGVINLSPTFAPYHVVGFSPESLKFVLQSSGLSVYQMEVPKWFNPIKADGNLSQKITRKVFGAVQTFGAAIGMGDGITCWARRQK